MPKKRGGPRKGAGRKKGSVSEETRIRQALKSKLLERVEKEFGGLMDTMISLAKGITVEEENADGTSKIYFKAPNAEILKYLTDQTLGKAKETLDVHTVKTLTEEEIEAGEEEAMSEE